MAGVVQRVSIIVIAIVFFVSSVGVSGLVIYQAVTKNDNQTVDQANLNEAQSAQNQQKLADFTPVNEVPELQVSDPKPGDGDAITSAEQTVTVDYTGAVAATGVIFDSSAGKQPQAFPLNNLIPGWQEGMIGMKEGGTRRMLIPADKAYGATPPQGSGIPANAPLVFDVTLKEVK